MGSPRSRTIETPLCRAIEAWFAPGDVLAAHTHDRSLIGVMLEGSFETRIGSHRLECGPGSMWAEPAEERHANYIGTGGARVVVVQPDPLRTDVFQPFERLTSEVHLLNDPLLALDARRLAREMDLTDALAPLSIDSLSLGMLVRAARRTESRAGRAAPSWLGRVRELLHERFRSPPTLLEICEVAGVTPSHLCHAFRRHLGTTIGEYVRAIRMTWAAERLRTTRVPLSTIAVSAGYADQSHFTRECKRLLGLRPSEYRRRALDT
ncbi:MAG TPA: AraC family transcriptional regulator [Gemmatimonadaceae bacterium]|nr:AraC family transcriptional regulator [Gemmatimonadaceae bacterium]